MEKMEATEREIAHIATKQDVAEVVRALSPLNIRMDANFRKMIRWMFVFGVGQMIAMVGMLYYFVK